MIELLLPAIVDLSDKTLTLPSGTVVPVAIGKPSTPTPTGIFSVVRKVIDPIDYSHITKRRIADGTYGNYAIGIVHNQSGDFIGLHGTNNQNSIGQSVSAGCVRIPRKYEKQVFTEIKWITDVIIQE